MSSIGTGYDLSASTFSPDGRVFQVEYAGKAVENSGTAIGVACKDGVVFAVEKFIPSKMLVEGTNRRVFAIDKHAGMAVSGLLPDGRVIVNRARANCREYKKAYGINIPGKVLNDYISQYVHAHTLYWHMRPFGTSVLMGVYEDKPELYSLDTTGVSYKYYACAVGKGKQAAKTELEKMKFSDMSCRDALFEISKIIYTIHDDIKDKEFELELGWVCDESNRQFEMVPKSIRDDIDKRAKEASEEDMEDDD